MVVKTKLKFIEIVLDIAFFSHGFFAIEISNNEKVYQT